MAYKKAGILIIGDEILKGQVNDVNSVYMCKRLHAIGVKVYRITTIPDDVDEIAEEVSRFAKEYNIVITTGGIGPTHDDITYEGVAKALNEKIILHSEMAEVIRHFFHGSSDIKENPALKMALIPENSKLIYISSKVEGESGDENASTSTSKTSFPIVQVGNVFILPGVTNWCLQAFDHLLQVFQNPDVNIFVMKLYINASELKIIDELNRAVVKFEKSIVFGSYPTVMTNGEFKTKITMESKILDDVCAAHSFLKSILPPEYLKTEFEYRDAEDVYELTNGRNTLAVALSDALRIIEKAYAEYKVEEVYLCFNGGKDCTVLMHVVWAVMHKHLKVIGKLNTLYVKSEDTFEEVDSFIQESSKRYNLNLTTVSGPMKAELEALVRENPSIKAVLMGTRRTDPYSQNLKSFQMCDPGWPQIMRINPLLDWSYHDLWNFLRLLDVPYCSLYDMGYTSLGSVRTTRPNPALEILDLSTSQKKYEPAYKLLDGNLERHGRN